MAQLVEDGVTGRVVPPGDIKALAEALKTLVTDPQTLARFSHRLVDRENDSDAMLCHGNWLPLIAISFVRLLKTRRPESDSRFREENTIFKLPTITLILSMHLLPRPLIHGINTTK